MSGSFAWPALMRVGIGQLKLRPEEFWAMTPAELMVMLGQSAGGAPMGRARLADLLKAYPDRPVSAPAGPADERRSDE